MAYPFENWRINSDVITKELFKIHGMEDCHLYVIFRYPAKTWNGCVPIKSKYQGINIPLTKEDVKTWVLQCYTELDPAKNTIWQRTQRQFWDGKRAYATQAVFDALDGDEDLTKWQCRK